MYYSESTVRTSFVQQGHMHSHDVARKSAKFTMKLSATRHALLGRCGE